MLCLNVHTASLSMQAILTLLYTPGSVNVLPRHSNHSHQTVGYAECIAPKWDRPGTRIAGVIKHSHTVCVSKNLVRRLLHYKAFYGFPSPTRKVKSSLTSSMMYSQWHPPTGIVACHMYNYNMHEVSKSDLSSKFHLFSARPLMLRYTL